MLGVAKVMGALAQRLGQPAVLGELIGGVLVGKSVLGLVNSDFETIHLLAELGVVILLFAIGLETDLGRLLKVGATSMTVAIVGVALPFVLGFAACRLLGLTNLVSIMAGATLTATSVGITARVLSDLGRLHDPEGQIILGAAVIDDILGLTILTVVTGLTEGREITLGGILATTATTVGFLVATVLVGRLVVPLLLSLGRHHRSCPVRRPPWRLIAAFGLAWLAEQCGFGDDHRSVRGRDSGGEGSASPRDRARDHRDRTFLRPAFFRRGRGIGRFERSRSLQAGQPFRPGHRSRADRRWRGRQARSPVMRRSGSAATRRSWVWVWSLGARSG